MQLRVEQLEDRSLLSWTPIGPAPILDGETPGNMPVTGRVTAVAGDPTNAKVLYVAAAGGGLWKTTDGGTSWIPLTDGPTVAWGQVQPVEFMGALAVAPSNPNIIYAGTGEANNAYESFYGRGVLKSIDGGKHWMVLGNDHFDRRTISQIIVSPQNPNVVYLTVNGGGVNGLQLSNTGLWKSSDGGITWHNLTTSISTSEPFTDVALDPVDPNSTFYTAVGDILGSSHNGIYRTRDGGSHWTRLDVGLPSGTLESRFGRIRLATANIKITPNLRYTALYATIEDAAQNTFGYLYRVLFTIDGATPPWADITPSTPFANYMGFQGWYDTTLAVDPHNPFIIFVGGQFEVLEFQNSVPGGWFDISVDTLPNPKGLHNGPHVDHHGIGFDASGRLLDGNDGGIWRLDTSVPGKIHWSDLNGDPGKALQITQFVGIATHPTDANIVYGGSQDNGREEFTGSLAWDQIDGGDGGFIRVDQVTPDTVYGEYELAGLSRSYKGGARGSWVYINPPFNGRGNFYEPYVIDPSDHKHLVFGSDGVWSSFDQGDTWTEIGTPGKDGFNPPNNASVDAVATNGQAIYASSSDRIFVSNDLGKTWATRGVPGQSRVKGLIADPDPKFPGVAFAVQNVFGFGKVFFTKDYGVHWSDITLNLPDVPGWSLAFDPRGTGSLYVGLDNGVYFTQGVLSPQGPGTWVSLDTGLPHVQVTGLELNSYQPGDANSTVLTAGTYGHGVYRFVPDPCFRCTNPDVFVYSPVPSESHFHDGSAIAPVLDMLYSGPLFPAQDLEGLQEPAHLQSGWELFPFARHRRAVFPTGD
jgi:photosystem II stability/assembly factor-like uncharacterized protein